MCDERQYRARLSPVVSPELIHILWGLNRAMDYILLGSYRKSRGARDKVVREGAIE